MGRKEPRVQADIVDALKTIIDENEQAQTHGGFFELREEHIIFLEALGEERLKESDKVFNAIYDVILKIRKRGDTHATPIYGKKSFESFTPNEEEEAELTELGEKINAFIEEGKQEYIKKFANDTEKIKVDVTRVILAETFEDFSLFRAVELVAFANERRETKKSPYNLKGVEPSTKEAHEKALRAYNSFKMLDYYLNEHIAATFLEVWGINHTGENARKEWKKTIKDATDRLYKEWLEKTPKEELEGIGLLKKTKETKADKEEAVKRVPILNKPDKLKILVSAVKDNLIQSNLDFLKLPVDGQQKFFMEDGEKGRKVEERPAKYKDNWGKTQIGEAVYSRVYMTLEKGVTFTDKRLWKVDNTDLIIFTHVLTLLAYGNYEMTAEQIYEQITQGKTRITKEWAERIDLFFIKFSSRRLGIIYSDLVKAGMIPITKDNKTYLDKGGWEEQILVYKREPYLNKWNNWSWKYTIRDMPFIYIYSEWRDLIISVDMDLLTTGTETKSNTENAINIRHYLLMRIGRAKRKKAKKTLKDSDTTILIDTLIDKSLSPFEIIDKGNGKRDIKAIEVTRKKKQATLDIAESILQDLKARKEIKGYSIPRETKGRGGRYEKILFEL